jgi:hypothetical protein
MKSQPAPDPIIGTLVTYRGSLTDLHGTYLAALCRCRACIGHGMRCSGCASGTTGACGDGAPLVLADPEDSTRVLKHPSRSSLTPAAAPAS